MLNGKERKGKTVVNPGQYIAVSNVGVFATQDVWVLEDFSDCLDIGTVSPNKVPGGVQVVLIDENGDVHDIDDDLAACIGGFIELTDTDALIHVEDVIVGSTLRVMVKFQPLDEPGMIGRACTNAEILVDGTGEPLGEPALAGLVIE